MTRGLVRWQWGFLAFVASFIALASPRRADAYAWMIRHDYTGCNQCHADPSGGGLLTAYGRAQSELLLRTRYGSSAETEESVRAGQFLFGALPLPEELLLGGDVRGLFMRVQPKGLPASERVVLMQTDFAGQLTVGRFRVGGSVGYADTGALPAALTHKSEHNIVSRLHWIGLELGADREWLLRAGRTNLPFGIRNVEHSLWVRSATHTDTNVSQQHGVSIAYNGEGLRGELMATVGNLQVTPSYYRAWGYSGFVEYAPSTRVAVGVSSMVSHAGRDVYLQIPLFRAAHGAFVRTSALGPIVLMAEVDLLVQSEPPSDTWTGHAAMVQADWEVLQGLHVMTTLESQHAAEAEGRPSVGAWGSLNWFFAPHADLRFDAIWKNLPAGAGRMTLTSLLAQLHFFL